MNTAEQDGARDGNRGFWKSPMGIATIAALVLGGAVLLWSERPDVLSWVPWLFVLACPLLHLFLHRHGDRRGSVASEHAEIDPSRTGIEWRPVGKVPYAVSAIGRGQQEEQMTKLLSAMRARPPRAPRPALRRLASLAARLALALQLSLVMLVPGAADDTTNFKTVDGINAYLGLIPAEIVFGRPNGHVEPDMHGGAPRGPHAYHLVVALFDDSSGERIEDAEVEATVAGLGHVGRSSVRLEPMLIADTVTYGAFLDLRAFERFDIVLAISGPDRREPVRVDFSNQHRP